MEVLIRFRELFSQLNEIEQHSFLEQITSELGIDFIITSIFHHFAESILKLKPQKITNQLNDIIKMVTNIIESRDKTPTTNKTYSKLDELPSELIGKTASFLTTNEYLMFCHLNRDLYIACNSPLQLQRFQVCYYYHDIADCINWEKYSNIKELNEVIFPDIIDSLQPFQDKISFNNLNALAIGFNSGGSGEFTLDDVDEFLALKCINFEKINRLSIRYIGDKEENEYQDPVPLLKFLAAFPNIEYLELHAVELRERDYLDKEIKLFPSLKGLRLTMCNIDIQCKLLEIYSDQIEVLICDELYVIYDIIQKKFPKLKELDIWRDSEVLSYTQLLCGIISKTTNLLQKVCVNMNESPDIVRDVDFESVINVLITSCSNLEYFNIVCDCQLFNKLCKWIVNALSIFKKNKMKKRKFKMKFNVWFDENAEVDGNDIILSLKHVVDALRDCNINDFMLYATLSTLGKEIIIEQTNVFEEECGYTVNCHGSKQTKIFAISKKNSNLTYQDEIDIFKYIQ